MIIIAYIRKRLNRLFRRYLVWKVIAIHLITVRLAARTLNLDAMTLQDGCFFKNTELIIVYRSTLKNVLNDVTVSMFSLSLDEKGLLNVLNMLLNQRS